ncbi:hypothetical protein FW778_17180 [Ginsengibacter hankyongi]|uniref:Uncharacterized protein n=1 Tax=Ginsengibacter hankyongi TaxID=2607284 RepID=A0A5J5IHE1_9BACT|nr:hypothetical protein [Ginsengibacter hankyongi]KAA9037162.1 hypothetical protein FW778_17180 [Ginsengibacter hankyongi]
MSKNIVYPYVMFTQFIDEPILKRHSLFFDSIYISELRLSNILNTDPTTLKEEFKSLAYERTIWEFLIDNQIVKTYPFSLKYDNPANDEEANVLIQEFLSLMPQSDSTETNKNLTEEDIKNNEQKALNHFFLSHDISVRLDSINLRKKYNEEFYPALRTNSSFNSVDKKSEIIQFLLNDIPEPALNTPWEEIIEFRSDEDVKNKYLALINWINKTAISASSLSDIKDEYEYLYNDYMKHFKLHKLKYNNTLLEVMVTAGAGILMAFQAGEFISPFKNLLQMNLSHIKLLEEEAKLPGKEVAYIYHAKKQFVKD